MIGYACDPRGAPNTRCGAPQKWTAYQRHTPGGVVFDTDRLARVEVFALGKIGGGRIGEFAKNLHRRG